MAMPSVPPRALRAVDFVADRYKNARVTVATVAGFYFYAYPYTSINHTSSECVLRGCCSACAPPFPREEHPPRLQLR